MRFADGKIRYVLGLAMPWGLESRRKQILCLWHPATEAEIAYFRGEFHCKIFNS